MSECFQFCWDNGAYLAEFLTSEEEVRVNDILAKDLNYWIGLADFAHEGQYCSQFVHKTLHGGRWY